jgi:hypothetical protein
MNAPVAGLPTANPVGVDIFDCDRRAFLQSFREFMADPLVPPETRADECRATISAMSRIAALVEVG